MSKRENDIFSRIRRILHKHRSLGEPQLRELVMKAVRQEGLPVDEFKRVLAEAPLTPLPKS